MDLSGNNNKFLNDEELSKLDRYKSNILLKSINECNMYVQTGAMILMADQINDSINTITRPVSALYVVMDYVNNGSIPREALIEVIYNLMQYVQDKNLEVKSVDFQKISFTINVLHQLLLENSSFKIYSCKKSFMPKLSLNKIKTKIKRGQMLYLLDRDLYQDEATKQNIMANVFFAVETGIWYYVLDEELINLKGESYKK